MYFPTNTCKRLKPTAACAPDDNLPLPSSLAEIAKIGGAREETVIDIQSGSEGELVAVLTQGELSVWSVKPSIALCKIKRSHLSIRQHGINERVYWRDVPEWTLQDTPGLIVQVRNAARLCRDALYRCCMNRPQSLACCITLYTRCQTVLSSIRCLQSILLDQRQNFKLVLAKLLIYLDSSYARKAS